jgi:hypothetical protein
MKGWIDGFATPRNLIPCPRETTGWIRTLTDCCDFRMLAILFHLLYSMAVAFTSKEA